MAETVLFVDDEPSVLSSIKRSLWRKFSIETAGSGDEALRMMAKNGTYAVIVSDMRMPGMNGIELLTKAREVSPDSVRLMLTGNGDQQTAVDAVNVGDVFRFLTKPCETERLAKTIESAIRQYRLVTAERQLLEKTLRGSIKALSDVLALSNPGIFGRATRIRSQVTRVVRQMKLDDAWKYESAALLSQIGSTGVDEALVRRHAAGQPLSEEETARFADHARIGAELIGSIPRLEGIAEMIRYQERNFDGSGFPADGPTGAEIPLGARILRIVLEHDRLLACGLGPAEAVSALKARSGACDPELLAGFEQSQSLDETMVRAMIDIPALTDAMVLAEDVRTLDGLLLVCKGQEASLGVRRRLQMFFDNGAIGRSAKVWVRPDQA